MRSRKKLYGFTLVELMVVVALLAIFASIALPSFDYLIGKNRVQSATNELLGLIQSARALAVESNASVSVCLAADGVWAVKKTALIPRSSESWSHLAA